MVGRSSEICVEKVTSKTSDIVEAINNLSRDLADSIVAASSDATLEKIGFAIFVAIIGAFSAFLFNYLHWRVVRKRENSSSLGRSLVELINNLELLAVEYWVKDYEEANRHDFFISEVKIKSTIRLIGKYEKIYSSGLNDKKHNKVKVQLDEFISEIYDIVTGDGFESTTRVASKQKAAKISRECSDARVAISRTIIDS